MCFIHFILDIINIIHVNRYVLMQAVASPCATLSARVSPKYRCTAGETAAAAALPSASPNVVACGRPLQRRSSLSASQPHHPSFRPLGLPPSLSAGALVPQEHSGLQAALPEADVHAFQPRSISCDGAMQTTAQPPWTAAPSDAFCRSPLQQSQQQAPPPPPSPQQRGPKCADAAPVAPVAAAAVPAPQMQEAAAMAVANSDYSLDGRAPADPREQYRSVNAACGLQHPDICATASTLGASLADK